MPNTDINYFKETTGIEEYLWFKGGKECINSSEVAIWFLDKAGRWLTKASQIIKRKNITEITDTIEPNLATTFQYVKKSG